MSKGHNKGQNREEQSEAGKKNVPGQNRHLKHSKQEDSPNQGRNTDDQSYGRKKGSNSI